MSDHGFRDIPPEQNILQVGQWWKHYKGQVYEIIALPRYSSDADDEDGTLAVVYRQLNAPAARPWVQSAERFLGVFVRGNRTEARFVCVGEVESPSKIRCMSCGADRTFGFSIKCCPEHTPEGTPDVVCEHCHAKLHPRKA